MTSNSRYTDKEMHIIVQRFLNDSTRLKIIKNITHLYECAPLKRIIVVNGVMKIEIDDWYQIQIDYLTKELTRYELKAYPNLFKAELLN